jgi:hypothetical protein
MALILSANANTFTMAGDITYRSLAHMDATGGSGRIPVRRFIGLM